MKKLLSSLLVLTVVLTFLPFAQAADFPDVPASHPNYTAVNFLRERSVINGYEDGTYKPNRDVTRAEFLKIILLSSGHPALPGDLDRQTFPDVPSTAWYFGLVNRGLALGVISGYPDGTFKPDRTVSRVEALKIMLRANNITETVLPTSGANYSDIAEGLWYTPYARYAMVARLFDGSQLRPNEMMNRGQVAEMVYRFYQHRPDLLPSSPLPTSAPTPTPTATSTAVPTSSSTPAPTVTASTSFRVNSASMLAPTPASYTGVCPAWGPINFVGIVNTNGQAGNIAYRWERDGGAHMTNFTVIGIPAGQNSVSLHWSPNWDTSVNTSYRLHVLNNADGTNQADSNYQHFSIVCTSSSPSPSSTSVSTTALATSGIGLAYSGPSGYVRDIYGCPSPLVFGFKGVISTNGQAGTVRYFVADETGNRSPEETYTFSAGQTDSMLLTNTINYTDNSSHWVRYVRRFVITPDGQTHNSEPLAISAQCSAAYASPIHWVERATFTANQPSWGTRYVCGRDNTYILSGRIYMRQPAMGGTVRYRWLFNNGTESSTMVTTYTPGSSEYLTVPEHPWTISRTAAEGDYTVWLDVLEPNTVTSSSVTVTKPRCVSL